MNSKQIDWLPIFKQTIECGKGAVVIGVCKGKISEGIDFADNAARWVIVVGIPYAPYESPKIKIKMNSLNSK